MHPKAWSGRQADRAEVQDAKLKADVRREARELDAAEHRAVLDDQYARTEAVRSLRRVSPLERKILDRLAAEEAAGTLDETSADIPSWVRRMRSAFGSYEAARTVAARTPWDRPD